MDLFSSVSKEKLQKKDAIPQIKKEPSISFDSVVGQQRVKEIIARILSTGRIASSYLFTGPQGCGKDAMAIAFAQALNCSSTIRPCRECKSCRQISEFNHPDLKFVFARSATAKEEEIIDHLKSKAANPYGPSQLSETASILIDQIRDLKNTANLRRFSGRFRIFIISQADRMTTEAANSLLKLLEEPPERLVLILTTERPDKLPPTIISRCQKILFSPLTQEEVEQKLVESVEPSSWVKIVSRLCMGNLQKAYAMLDESFQELREEAIRMVLLRQEEDINAKIDFAVQQSREKDRSRMRELFQLVLFYLRDIMVLLNNPDGLNEKHNLYNADQLDRLEELGKRFDIVTLEKTIADTENSIDLIDKYIYINLILLNYLIV